MTVLAMTRSQTLNDKYAEEISTAAISHCDLYHK